MVFSQSLNHNLPLLRDQVGGVDGGAGDGVTIPGDHKLPCSRRAFPWLKLCVHNLLSDGDGGERLDGGRDGEDDHVRRRSERGEGDAVERED